VRLHIGGRPRLNEINEMTARAIMLDLDSELGEG
jgi:hypothetical protein